MKIIQWQTGPAKASRLNMSSDEFTKHCLFRLDIVDRDLIDSDTVKYIQNYMAKDAAENGGEYSGHLVLRVDEDDLEEYKMKCLEKFALLIGLLKPNENIVDWIRKF